jgi:hypothetical protein
MIDQIPFMQSLFDWESIPIIFCIFVFILMGQECTVEYMEAFKLSLSCGTLKFQPKQKTFAEHPYQFLPPLCCDLSMISLYCAQHFYFPLGRGLHIYTPFYISHTLHHHMGQAHISHAFFVVPTQTKLVIAYVEMSCHAT